MSNKLYIILILIFGFILTPKLSYACSLKVEQTTEKDCCKKENKISLEHEKCDGSCDNNSCNCTPFQFNFYSIIPQEIKSIIFNINNIDRKKNYQEHFICSGYHSIWQPPKIG